VIRISHLPPASYNRGFFFRVAFLRVGSGTYLLSYPLLFYTLFFARPEEGPAFKGSEVIGFRMSLGD